MNTIASPACVNRATSSLSGVTTLEQNWKRRRSSSLGGDMPSRATCSPAGRSGSSDEGLQLAVSALLTTSMKNRQPNAAIEMATELTFAARRASSGPTSRWLEQRPKSVMCLLFVSATSVITTKIAAAWISSRTLVG